MAYTTYTDLKVYLNIPVATSADDTLLTTLIARAQAIIDAYCRQTFEASGDTTRYFDPTRDVSNRTLFLDAPLCVITSVTNGDGSTVSSSDYVKEPRNGATWYALTLKANAAVSWTWTNTPENAISIVGRWAYATSAPVAVVQACTRLAAWLYRQRDNANDLDRAVIVGDATILPAQIPSDIRTILAPYRRMLI